MATTELNSAEQAFLRESFRIAEAARERGNHPFGALLVSADGSVLARAENSVVTDQDLTAHAELNLIRDLPNGLAAGQLSRSTMYASTEPCPMCAGAIHWSGIGRVVFGLSSPRLYELSSRGGEGEPIDLSCREVLRRSGHRVEVVGPALEQEAEAVHEGFW